MTLKLLQSNEVASEASRTLANWPIIRKMTLGLVCISGTFMLMDLYEIRISFWGTLQKQLYLKAIGLALAMFVANPIIALAIHFAKIPDQTLSPTEVAVGRMIGYIERLLAFCFVLDGADNAITMLIAAKGVYRLHELGGAKELSQDKVSGDEPMELGAKMHEKTFYVMAVTFTSIAYAIMIAFVTRFVVGLL